MKFVDLSAKIFKKVTCLPKTLFSIDIMDIWVLPCFCILFKRRLKSVTKAFMSNVVLGDLKISEPIDYSCTVNIWWNVTVQSGIQTIKKGNLSFLSLSWVLIFFFLQLIERSKNNSLEIQMFLFLSCNSEGYTFLKFLSNGCF